MEAQSLGALASPPACKLKKGRDSSRPYDCSFPVKFPKVLEYSVGNLRKPRTLRYAPSIKCSFTYM